MPVIPYFDAALALLDDALASDEPPPASDAAASSQSAAPPPKPSPTVVEPAAAAAFLLRCAKTPQRFFYPCNAKAREPVTCVYRFQRGVARGFGPGPSICEARVFECAYDAGGTGWRAWPSALLLACWCAEHYGALELARARVCELGCGLGLPGLAAAALGAADVTLTDCLPRLLATVRESAQATAAANGGRAPSVSVLDWDVEAPPDAAAAAEAYSTEQGVRSAQRCDDEAADEAPLAADARFDVLLATDVIYSRAHAAQLPAVVARRLAPGGRLCAMVPVRSEGDARTFLGGLQRIGADVRLARVTAEWCAAATAAQRGEAPGGAARAEAPYEAGMALQEGEVVFVEAVVGRQGE